ncbi:EamA family transporter [Rossellomorea marisflavi]|uniref:EamA family transporter n=1 Tax=Rossellomorea marisflavi TaxID=189381 RepID=A0A5D4RA26_9BACI|nr:EamA family transporter [Rossellomorea marisflavi]TYS48235.1 EamA family transporter [Rossellomorea marisflavi]
MKSSTYFKLIGFAVFTGATFNLAKYAVQYLSPASAAAWRFGIAALVLILLLGLQKQTNFKTVKSHWKMYILLGIIGVFGFNTFFFWGMQGTSPLNGALIMGTNPLVTTILAYLILKNPINKKQILGISFALIGVILVLTQGSLEIIQTLSISKGDLLILAGNVCWAIYGVLGKKYLNGSSSFETTTYTMIVGAICLLILTAFSSSPQPLSNVTWSAWGAIIFMAIFTSVLGYLWWNKGMAIIGATNTSLFFNLVPVVTMLLSFLTGVVITVPQVVGTFLVILGVLTASGFIKLRKRPQVTASL